MKTKEDLAHIIYDSCEDHKLKDTSYISKIISKDLNITNIDEHEKIRVVDDYIFCKLRYTPLSSFTKSDQWIICYDQNY